MSIRIVLTGGGTAGHVVPNLAIADAMSAITKKDLKITYMGSRHGVEQKLIERTPFPYVGIATGKLRRYFDLKNFTDIFKIFAGTVQAWRRLGTLKPDVVFSKGGFVGFPVVVGAWFRGIPVIIHESDALPGLATKLCAPFARSILLNFEEAKEDLGKYAFKCKVVGNPVRADITKGNKTRAKKITGFTGKRPVLLVMGGSTGSAQINKIVELELESFVKTYDVIHLTGEGKGRKKKTKHYFSMPYAHEELKDFYALTEHALSRAGATVLSELEVNAIPTLLYPLGREASRGDQIANTKAIIKRHFFFRLAEETKSASAQLNLLPKRTGKTIKNTSAVDIARFILTTS